MSAVVGLVRSDNESYRQRRSDRSAVEEQLLAASYCDDLRAKRTLSVDVRRRFIILSHILVPGYV